MQVNYFLSFTVFCLLISYGESFLITVDAHAEECFYDRVTSGSKMNLMFEVAEGGFLDIDVKVEGPDGSEIYNGNRESSGKRSFAAHMDGLYKYCFSNKMSSMTPKVVMFTMDIPGRPTVAELEVKKDEASPSKLEDMVSELTTALTGVKHDQEYMQLREKVHRAINDNTNERVLIWAFFEAFIIISMTLGQVYYLRHFFEVRRVV